MPPVEPIAIVGLGCRLPGADSPAAFWDLLVQGRDEISEVPKDRWDIDALYDPDTQAPGKVCTRWGGFLKNVNQFDAGFFSISPTEAERVDPQQRLILEVAWEALEDAWLSPQRLAGSDTGVFVAISHAEYARLINSDARRIIAYNGAGMYVSIAANRLSYSLDLQGPSMAIDTACSSSLVALHVACQSLRARECSVAIVGAVNLNLDPAETMGLTKAKVLSPDGRCKTFDDAANGYVRSDGCGVVILKRLADAVRDGDVIRAIIKGSAVNQDGMTNGLTAPSGPAQQAVIRRALEMAAVHPAEVDYVEAHGTGTPLGDPIEMNSIMAVYGRERPAHKTCWVGAVKTNIGHLEAASGMAGLLKVVLALQHRSIPRNLHLSKINRYLKLDGKPFRIPTEMQPWPVEAAAEATRKPVLAAISAFGFGGTNAHVIVSEAPASEAQVHLALNDDLGPQSVLALSAKNDAALRELVSKYEDLLNRDTEISLRDLCHSANRGRAHFHHRVAFVVESIEQLSGALKNFREGQSGSRTFAAVARQRSKVIFTFGADASRVGSTVQRLYGASSLFRDLFDRCERIFAETLSPPAGVKLGQSSFTSSVTGSATTAEHEAAARFAIDYCTAKLLGSWNIVPDVVRGRGGDELTAAAVAGLLSVEEGMRGAILYARLGQELPAGRAARMVDLLEKAGWGVGSAGPADPEAVDSASARRTFATRFLSSTTGNFEAKPFSDPAYWERLLTVETPLTVGLDSLLGQKNIIEVNIDPDRMMSIVASVYAVGVPVDWANLPGAKAGKLVKLPTYPFQRSRYWYECSPAPEQMQSRLRPQWLLSPGLTPDASVGAARSEMELGGEQLLFLHDHRVLGRTIVPAAAFIEIAAAASLELDAGKRVVRLSDIAFRSSCVLAGLESSARLRVTLSVQGSSRIMRINDAEFDGGIPYMVASLGALNGAFSGHRLDLARYGQPLMDAVPRYYADLASQGLEYGPCFRAIQELYACDAEFVGRLRLPQIAMDSADSFVCHPALLDACFQVVGYAAATRLPLSLMVPVGVAELTLVQNPTRELWCRVTGVKTDVGPSGRGISADIELFDGRLEAMGAVKGFALAPLDAAGPRVGADLAEWQFDPTWHLSSDSALASQSGGVLLLVNAPDSLAEMFRPHCQTLVRLESEGLHVRALRELTDTSVLSGVVYFPRPQLGQAIETIGSHSELLVEEARGLRELIRALTENAVPTGLRVVVATIGAHRIGADGLTINPLHTALWGIGRCIATEYPNLDCRLVDFDTLDAQPLLKELAAPGRRYQFAWRNSRRYEMSLQRRGQMRLAVAEEFRTALCEQGDLDRWECVAETTPEIRGDEVRVAVAAVGLNFRDVLVALGRLPAPRTAGGELDARDIPFGGECVGTIIAVGKSVTRLCVGDEVMVALTPGCLATSVIVQANRVIKKPSGLSSLQAATVSTAFLTAYYAMSECVTLRSGQRVLVHAAAGAVGQACCQLALSWGVEVIATASRGKWAFLRGQGIAQVLDSRSPNFGGANEHSRGWPAVDVVVNSLGGDFTAASLDVLKMGGAFIEIGKAGVWSQAQVAAYRPDVTYKKFDLLEIANQDPQVLAMLLERMRTELIHGAIRSLSFRAFPLEEVGRAFRYLASGRHIGKVVIEMPESTASAKPPALFAANASYLVTGAYGNLGLQLTQWAVSNGCRDLVLLGRSRPSAAAESLLQQLRDRGCEVRVQVGDVADPMTVEQLFEDARQRGKPLKGMFHLAGVTRDAALTNTTDQDWLQVLQPKIAGLWNLHRAAGHDELDMFVCFSSASSQVGPQGQASYAAANGYMDGLVAHRAQVGLPALSINWGPVGELAVAGSKASAVADYLVRSGLRLMEPSACFALLKRYLRHAEQQVMVLPFDSGARSTADRSENDQRLLAAFENLPQTRPAPPKQQRTAALQGLSASEVLSAIAAAIKDVLAESLHLDSASLATESPLVNLGVDSMLAMEIETKLERQFGVALTDALDVQSSSISELAGNIVDRLAQAGLVDGPVTVPEQPRAAGRDSGAVRRARDGTVQLFCFHHLGGSASIYRDWLAAEPDDLDILPVELPGRETRLRESFAASFQGLLFDLATEIRKKLRGRFALYGHSMGALVAYEMARYLQEDMQVSPTRLFVGGLWAPHKHNEALEQRSFTIANAIRQAEIPQRMLQDPDAMGRLNRIFEADARLFQSYRWVERPPVPFPITAFGGQTDPVASEVDLMQWQHCTHGDFAVRMVPGGHLFIRQSGRLVLQSIHAAIRVR